MEPLRLNLGCGSRQLDGPWKGQLARGEISQEEVSTAERRYNNVVSQIHITLRVEKP